METKKLTDEIVRPELTAQTLTLAERISKQNLFIAVFANPANAEEWRVHIEDSRQPNRKEKPVLMFSVAKNGESRKEMKEKVMKEMLANTLPGWKAVCAEHQWS